MNVPPGWTVLHCGVAKRRAGAEPAAMLAQACDKRGRKAGCVLKVEAVEEQYRLHGIGEQVITSFIQFKCLELSKDKMCISNRASLMATRQHWSEVTTWFRGFVDPSASWSNHGKVDGDDVKPCVGEHG